MKTVAIYDNEPAIYKDMSSNFYITEEDIGKPRAEVGVRCFCDSLGVPAEIERAESVCDGIPSRGRFDGGVYPILPRTLEFNNVKARWSLQRIFRTVSKRLLTRSATNTTCASLVQTPTVWQRESSATLVNPSR